MTSKELSDILGISEGTLKNQFKREANRLEKKGIIISKEGRGENTVYSLDYDDMFKDGRALTLFEEEKTNIYLEDDMLKMLNWNLLVFLGICLTPLLVFRGSYKDFLKYLSLPQSKQNLIKLKETLIDMNETYIGYYPDKTDENYFTASMYRAIEKELKVSITRIRQCKEIQLEYNNHSFVPILKTWIATEKAIENQPYTTQDLSDMTGLAKSTITKINKQLKEKDVYKSKKDFDNKLKICRGVNSEMNAFYGD